MITGLMEKTLHAIYNVGLEHNNDVVTSEFKSYQRDLNGTEQDYIAGKLIGCLVMDEKLVNSMRDCSKLSSLEYTHEWFTSSSIISGMKGHQLGHVHIYVDYSVLSRVVKRKDVSKILKLKDSELYSNEPTVSMTPCDRMLLGFFVDSVKTVEDSVVVPVCYFMKFSAATVKPLRYEKHCVKVVLRLDGGGAVVAHYTDQACCAGKREMLCNQTLYLSRCRPFILKRDNESSRPPWTFETNCTVLPMRNIFFCRCYDFLKAALLDCGVAQVQQTQMSELQPWKIEYCATSFLATMHLGIDDDEIARIKTLFGKHPNLASNKCRGEEDRSAQLTFLNMYEVWLYYSNRALFEEAKVYSETNSITFDDEISFGVCRVCNQGDSPGVIMVCEVPECIEYAHTFCKFSSNTDEVCEQWWCDAHSAAKKRSHEEMM
jgi:hypothetical protein